MMFNGMTSISSRVTQLFGNKIGQTIEYFTMFTSGMWIFFYLQSSYYCLKNSYNTNNIINLLLVKLQNIVKVVRNVTEINLLTKNLFIFNKVDNELDYFNNIFSCDIFDNDPTLFCNKGKILYTYKTFLDNKDKLIPIFQFIGEIDTYLSLSNLIYDGFCFTKYIDPSKKTRPYLYAKNIYHPSLGLDGDVVKNTIQIGNKTKNLLITGPNKSGKSTFIKSLALAVIFSQSIGIVSAEKFRITPFTIINTYLQIPDETGRESLFEAEMNRAKEYIETLDSIRNNEFSFIIMDEIFTSTNYIEGYSAAFAICKKLSEYRNSISVITTHFTNMTNKRMTNYKFVIDRNEDDDIIYTYKMKRGVSKQYIALELLKKAGFHQNVIDEAIQIAEKMERE